MTFRIDTILFEPDGRWTCSFKGFRGQGVYGRARLGDNGSNLLLESTLDTNDRVVLPVGATPVCTDSDVLHRWIAQRLDSLGWGPEVNQVNQVIRKRG